MTAASIPLYQRSARTDLRIWGLFLVGLAFVWAGSTVDPLRNCGEDGACAPWLVPLAFWLGTAFACAGAGLLWANPRRGSRIDPQTGDLLWWQGADRGRIHPSRIARIRIVAQDDAPDAVHLYDAAGERQPFFDAEVIPWPAERWARDFIACWPHVRLETR